MNFPVQVSIGSTKWPAHFVMELLAYSIGFQIFLRLRSKNSNRLPAQQQLSVVAAAIAGAAIGSLFLARLADGHLSLAGGKTIVGGLVGGLISVEIIKKCLGIQTSTGDLFVIPLAVGTIIGRIGCFFEGLADKTCGLPTRLPWGVDFGDGIPRHPTQLYEIVWVGLLSAWLVRRSRRPHRSGDLFKGYMVGYMGWRLLIDFLKPGYFVFGMTPIQWTCLVVLVYYRKDFPYLVSSQEVEPHG